MDVNIFALFLLLAKLSAKYLIPRIAVMKGACYLWPMISVILASNES